MTILEFFKTYGPLGPFVGPMIGASVTAAATFWIAGRYTRKMKRVDATLEFNKRFHELRKEQHEINAAFQENQQLTVTPSTQAGSMWWHRYFDLMLFQFHFFRQGLIDKDRFVQWMRWRFAHFAACDENQLKTCGIDYKEGWNAFKAMPGMDTDDFVVFLESIHRGPVNEIPAIVRRHAPWF